ncbi:class A beta-lactamase-related serine hydrolase [Fibrisoma montanum]|uniref:Class A beta-lactamase-related serine hydrolase n=1 Tax=Fibrisoma montanum TaxID=2305895 RepID=A0A418LVK1_9BACT|nr:serine hydrolase domain-containing protein [Fibrisoma montanum]RIV17268.1 class A beta-lactamase-related serine hydrolase [Fibrisoma montanum]
MQSYGQSKSALTSQRLENRLIPITKAGADSGSYQTIYERMKALNVPGVSIAVFDGGQIRWAKGYGLSDKSQAKPVDTATLFQAASISKPVTTVTTFRLIEAKTLSLDEDVNQKLRRWKVPENEYTTKEKVTVRRLVSHMAGLTVHGFAGYNPADKLPTVENILNGTPPANSSPVRVKETPGEKETYSGGGFTVLQLLLEDVTGKSFGALAEEMVLQPVGMKHSTFSLPLPSDKASRAAKGYEETGDMVDGGYHVYPELAAAGLWSTPSDLARFMINVSDSYRADKGILRQATVRQMLVKIPQAGGLGFGVDGSGETLRFRHSGGNAGFSCYAVAFAETGRGVVVMTNSDNGTPLIHELVRAITREYQWPTMWPKE